MLDIKTGENYRSAAERLQAERDEARARCRELETVIKESIRNHRISCPCPRCTAVIPQPTFSNYTGKP